jgi:hypothetical protein
MYIRQLIFRIRQQFLVESQSSDADGNVLCKIAEGTRPVRNPASRKRNCFHEDPSVYGDLY